MELHKNMGIWVKGDAELNTSEPVVMEPTAYLFLGPAEGSLASLEIQAELGSSVCDILCGSDASTYKLLSPFHF